MVALRIDGFAGMQQVLDPRLLDTRDAAVARNVDFRHRTLVGTPVAVWEATVPGATWIVPASRASGGYDWLGFPHYVSLVERANINDAYDRVYWTADGASGGAYYLPRANVGASTPLTLGVPAPTTAPTVTATGGTSPTIEDRTYIYVYRTLYGEQSGPSPPASVRSAPIDATWTISGLPATWSGTCAQVTHLDIYRVSSAALTGSYRYVGSVTLGTTSFVDNVPAENSAFALPFLGLDWLPAPSGLRGLVRHPSGALAGFVENTVHLSEPGYPHAWASSYAYSMPHVVTALGVVGNTIVVLTTGRVYFLSGAHPSSMVLEAGNRSFSVPSQRAVCAFRGGVVAASDEGVGLVAPGAGGRLTEMVFTPAQWRRFWNPQAQIAAENDWVVVWFGPSVGFRVALQPDLGLAASFFDIPQMDGVVSVPATNRAFFLRGDSIFSIEANELSRYAWEWTSKTFRLTKPENLGAVVVRGRLLGQVGVDTPPPDQIDTYHAQNDARWAAGPLDVLDGYVIGGEAVPFDPTYAFMPPLQPIGGEPLWRLSGYGPTSFAPVSVMDIEPSESVRLRVWADDRMIYDRLVLLDVVFRLPSGFKATEWRFEIFAGQLVEVTSLEAATTVEELKQV